MKTKVRTEFTQFFQIFAGPNSPGTSGMNSPCIPIDFKFFKTLQINENSDPSTARDAFIKLAKKYHPDSGHALADPVRFQEIDIAYRKVLEKFSQDRRDNDCEGEYGLYYDSRKEEKSTEKSFDIKHTAPQHRQYLSYEGIGVGTPSQREKQFIKYRAAKAAEHVLDYKVEQLYHNADETSLAAKDIKAAMKIRTRYGIDRLVEDKIQESMARGDFDNLPNAGKPLKNQNHNPYVDIITFKLNQILIDNGYAPEWVMLEKEIRDYRVKIREKIENMRNQLGPPPLSPKEQAVWDKTATILSCDVKELNKKIDKYNFVVPIMSKQTVHFNLKKELDKSLNEGRHLTQLKKHCEIKEGEENTWNRSVKSSVSSSEEKSGLRYILSIFKTK